MKDALIVRKHLKNRGVPIFTIQSQKDDPKHFRGIAIIPTIGLQDLDIEDKQPEEQADPQWTTFLILEYH